MLRGVLQVRNSLRETDPVRILAKALIKENWWDITGLAKKSWFEEINENLLKTHDLLKNNLEGKFTISETQEDIQMTFIRGIFLLWRSLQTFDCNSDAMSLAQVLRVALTRCVAAGGDAFNIETLQDSLDTLQDAISGIQVELETEKAARIRIGSGIEAAEIPVQ